MERSRGYPGCAGSPRRPSRAARSAPTAGAGPQMNDRIPVTAGDALDWARSGRCLLMYAQIHGVVVIAPPLPIQRVGGDKRSSRARLLRSLEDLSPPLLVTE